MSVELETPPGYASLTEATVPTYLADLPGIRARLGGAPDSWTVREVGDGNLNLVYLVDGPDGGLCLKQALPYVRLVGPSWPMPLSRAYFEYRSLVEHGRWAPGLVPEIYHYDPARFAIVMEVLRPHIIMRRGMIDGIIYPESIDHLATFTANTLFHTSTLSSTAAAAKDLMGEFAPNTELCKITEDLIFTDPYRTSDRNRWTSPQLDAQKTAFESDAALKIAISRLKVKFMGSAEALIHGDLHTGSVMVTKNDTRVIDSEFAFFGPRGFDLGAIVGNLLINYFSQDGHADRPSETPRAEYQDWVLESVESFWAGFRNRFLSLWETATAADAYPSDLFADSPSAGALRAEREAVMDAMFADMLGFGAAKMIRRILGLAHNIDLEWIEDADLRARCERRCLALARDMMVNTQDYGTIGAVTAAARRVLHDVA